MKKFNLKQWRKKHSITQKAFGKLTGIKSRETIRKIENGTKTQFGLIVERFCLLYDITNERK